MPGWSAGPTPSAARSDELRANGIAGTVAPGGRAAGPLRRLGATRIYLQVLDLTDLDHLELIAELLWSELL